MKFILTVILTLFISLQASAITECDKANAEYEKGDFVKAITLYTSILQVNYERALKFIPGDHDLLDNLKIVKLSLIDKEEAEKPDPFFNIIGKLRNLFNIYSVRSYFILSLILMSILLSLSILFKYSIIAKILNVLNIFVFVAFLFLGYFYYDINSELSKKFAVVNFDKISVLSSPDENVNSKELFFLHIGTKVELLRSNNNWYEISLPGDKIGWIKKDSVVEI